MTKIQVSDRTAVHEINPIRVTKMQTQPQINPLKALYDQDFYLWVQQTAAAIEARDFEQVDWGNLNVLKVLIQCLHVPMAAVSKSAEECKFMAVKC
ncbi:MAG: DUF29 family protein [Cyanobacteria bacterium P01_A01_bin.114]